MIKHKMARVAGWAMTLLLVALMAGVEVVSLAYGAPASQPVVQTVQALRPLLTVSDVLDWVLKLVGIVVATLVPILLQRWLGGKIAADKLAMYSKLAIDAVDHSEELGHRAIKSGAAYLDSNAKADAAVAYVAQAADALNLRPMAESAVKKLIDAKLGSVREPTS
jgi:hypothetical protein